MTQPTVGNIESDGLRVEYLDWGGSGQPLVMLHPNGFCGGFYAPLAERLTDSFRPVAVDLRGHGRSDTPTDPEALRYGLMADDVARVTDHLGLDEFKVLGVSLGGGVGVHLAASQGDRVTGLMLCEAIAFSVALAPEGQANHMSELARKRRAVWPSRDAMIDSYGSRPPFGALAPEFLAAYVEWGTTDRTDGSVELACDPETEALLFEIGASQHSTGRAFDLLAEINCPREVLAGAATDLDIERFKAQAVQAGVALRVLDGGHFFLQEDTDRAESLVREILR